MVSKRVDVLRRCHPEGGGDQRPVIADDTPGDVAGQKIEFHHVVLRQARKVGIGAGQPVLRIGLFEMVTADIHQVGGKQIDAKKRILVPHLDGIKRVRNVQPHGGAHEPLVAEVQLLPAHFDGERKIVEVTDRDVGQLKLEWPVVLGEVLPGSNRSVPVVAQRITRPQLDRGGDPIARVANARHQAAEPVFVAIPGWRRRVEIEIRTGMGSAGPFLVLVTQTFVYPDVPALEVGVVGQKIAVDRPWHGTRWRGGNVLGASRGG